MKTATTRCEDCAIARQRPGRSAPAPFVTRRSTIAFSAICLLAGLAFQSVVAGDASGSGSSGVLAAISLSAAIVCGLVAWVAGVVLALRAGSMLWVVLAALPIFPINSMMCAMFCPTTPTDRRR